MVKKACLKTKFANEESAKHVLGRIAKKNQDRKQPIRSYKCPDCGLWHLTSLPDIDALLEENDTLKKQVEELKIKNSLLINENALLEENDILKKQAEDLKNKNSVLINQNTQLTKQEGKGLRRDIRKDEVNQQLRTQISGLDKKNKSLLKDKNELLQTVLKLRDEIEKLKGKLGNSSL